MSFTMNVTNESQLKNEIREEVAPLPQEVSELQNTANQNVAYIMGLEYDSFEKRKELLGTMEDFGMNTMNQSSQKTKLLQVSIGSLSKSGGESGFVAKGLTELDRHIRDLDPSVIDFTKTGLLGKIFNPVRGYFAKYQKADAVISNVIESLEKGKATLKNDNTSLELEQESLRNLSKTLNKEIQLALLMDESITGQIEIARTKGEEAEKIRFIEEEILFPLRQKLTDMQTVLVLNQQGIIAFETVIRNNRELIRGVDRSKMVSVTALRNGVMVASALYNQRIVLDKLEAIDKTTNEIILGTSKLLKQQGVEIQKRASQSSVSIDVLKESFADAIESLNAISTFKQQALPQMRNTIMEFQKMAEAGDKELSRIEKGNIV